MQIGKGGAAAVLVAGLLALVAFARISTWAMETQSYNTWGALYLVPIILLVNAGLLSAAMRKQEDVHVRRILLLGFLAKLVGIAGRYFVGYYMYGGSVDAERYNLYAIDHYLDWRAGDVWWEPSGKVGTLNMELITTAVYVVIGPSVIAAFFVFGSLAFWGIYLIFRAFQIALPQGDARRYALLVFLLPSILFWPSSLGKEAWILLFVGVTAYGAARFFTHGITTGLVLLAVGAVGTALIRPHVTVLMFAALIVAQLFRPMAQRSTSILTKAAGLVVMLVAAGILMLASADFLGIDDLNAQAVADQIDWASGQTSEAGSSYTPVPLTSPWGIPAAFLTILFRPFPWEAGSLQMVVQSLEGVALLALTILAWPRLRGLPTLLRRSPWLVFAVAYVIAFVLAFAGFANFGILARQRVLMMPFFLVLLALPRPLKSANRASARREATRKELIGVRAW